MLRKQKIKHTLPSAELEYTIQYNWGQLHMTKAANDAYDIVPLTSVVDGGSDEYRHMDNFPSIDITITSPDEIVEPIRPVTNKKQPSLVGAINLGSDSDSLVDGTKDKLLKFIETSGFEIPDDYISELSETIERDTPQMMAHALVEMASRKAELLISENSKNNSEKRLIKRSKMLGFTAIGGSLLVTTPSVILNDGIINPFSVGIGLTYASIYVSLMHKNIKDYLKYQPILESSAKTQGYLGSLLIASDIHESFCRKHFDASFDSELQ